MLISQASIERLASGLDRLTAYLREGLILAGYMRESAIDGNAGDLMRMAADNVRISEELVSVGSDLLESVEMLYTGGEGTEEMSVLDLCEEIDRLYGANLAERCAGITGLLKELCLACRANGRLFESLFAISGASYNCILECVSRGPLYGVDGGIVDNEVIRRRSYLI